MDRELERKRVRSFGLWLTNGKKKAALSTFLPFSGLWAENGKQTRRNGQINFTTRSVI